MPKTPVTKENPGVKSSRKRTQCRFILSRAISTENVRYAVKESVWYFSKISGCRFLRANDLTGKLSNV